MKLTKLKIAGFKSFADAVDIRIEAGLTGVVGPNGCGKSNLVEALRWVMGETSHKNMRASTMDDVIFAGTNRRATRSHAEVMLTLDNTSRTAPAMLNDADILEVSRKIISGEGSHYRVNGREVRAKDVQLLFADAATGSRSSALVRQGQIAEIIAAKPQARRAILEDAAGIGGLYTRRREAEMRLKAADDNLVRVEDVLREIDSQLRRLETQAKQAVRYKELSAHIRDYEAQLMTLTWLKVRDQVNTCEQDLNAATLALTNATATQAQTAKDQAIAAHTLEPLRVQEQEKAQALQKIKAALNILDVEEKRLRERTQEIAQRIVEVERDQQREHTAYSDAQEMVARLNTELEALKQNADQPDERKAVLKKAHEEALSQLKHTEELLAVAQQKSAEKNAQYAASVKALEHEQKRFEQLKKEQALNQQQHAALAAQTETLTQFEALKQALLSAQEAANHAQIAADDARNALKKAQEQEHTARKPMMDAEKNVQRLETELRTLQKLFTPSSTQQSRKIIDQIHVKKGYEIALGAVFGDDLDASTDSSAPIYWAHMQNMQQNMQDDPQFDSAFTPLLRFTTAPPALHRALSQIAVVTYEEGEKFHNQLKVGQSLVSQAGDVWRWDGLITKAEAPNKTAKLLAEKNRLSELEDALKKAQSGLIEQQKLFETLQKEVKLKASQETTAFDALRNAQKNVESLRTQLSHIERQAADLALKQATLDETVKRCDQAVLECEEHLKQLTQEQNACAPSPNLEVELEHALAHVLTARHASTKAHADLHQFEREQADKQRHFESVSRDVKAWQTRFEKTQNTLKDLEQRLATLHSEQTTLQEAPDTFLISRRKLLSELQEAEIAQSQAAQNFANMQTMLAGHNRSAKDALENMAKARETKASCEARLESALTRRDEVVRHIQETLELTTAALCARTKHIFEAQKPPTQASLETQLSQFKQARDTLGAVNLRAQEELDEQTAQKQNLVKERDDLIEAIRRLRSAILNLNREGRERLLTAFDAINTHFSALFTQLFGGGNAELKLIESDDPLEAGLEIIANPPGKKPQILTLLSGGEQALTATALIFAVFLTNPSPICVLDEVDAPLDDANVERYCDLLQNMVERTDTRFIVITHNPITMSRMNRLYGVTMAERGVSMVLSVSLEQAQDMVQEVA